MVKQDTKLSVYKVALQHPIVKLHVRRTYTNLFFTLTDPLNKVLYTITAGMCSPGNKHRKTASQTVELMAGKLVTFLKQYKFKGVEILLKTSLGTHLRTLEKEFRYRGVSIQSFIDCRKVAHNGVWGRSVRRK